jgi:hypothetical protein
MDIGDEIVYLTPPEEGRLGQKLTPTQIAEKYAKMPVGAGSDYERVQQLAQAFLELKKLVGREARCTCGQTAPSTKALDGYLAFFEYRGEGSRSATEQCKHCGYYDCAHGNSEDKELRNVVEEGKCPGFEPKGDWGYDTYYCGCRGWD